MGLFLVEFTKSLPLLTVDMYAIYGVVVEDVTAISTYDHN